MKFNFKELIKGLAVICSYFILQIIYCMPFLFLYNEKKISENTLYIIVFTCMIVTYVIAYRKTLSKDFKDFKENYKTILKTTAKYWLMGLGIMIISSLFIGLLGLENATNQEQNITLFKNEPITQAILAILLAPILEEIVFRKSFQNFTNNKILFALVTGLIFGGIHVVSSITSIKDIGMILHIIPYSSVGIMLGYAYKEHNNILGTITIHALHNFIGIIEIMLFI